MPPEQSENGATGVEVVDEITHQGINVCRLRRNEGCFKRVPAGAADPVLDVPEALVLLFGQQRRVEVSDVIDGDSINFQ